MFQYFKTLLIEREPRNGHPNCIFIQKDTILLFFIELSIIPRADENLQIIHNHSLDCVKETFVFLKITSTFKTH